MGFAPGTQIADRFVIEGKLSSGGMAEVYVAQMRLARGASRRVALKRIHPHLLDDPELVAMFVEEARTASQLSHPGIVPVLDAVDDGDDLLLVLEYVPGWDLGALLRAAAGVGRVLPVDVAVHVGARLLDALAYCHAAKDASGHPLGLVHRDVSPSNVLLARDGTVRLLDFGVAKATARATRTATHTIKGKVAYMAPEQVRAEPVDGRTDLYALGLVLFELLTGRRAIDAQHEMAALDRARDPKHDPVASLRRDVPPALAAIVDHLRGVRPEDRPSSADDVARAIEPLVLAYPRASATTREIVEELLGDLERPLAGPRKVDRALALALGDVRAGTARSPAAAGGGWGRPDVDSAATEVDPRLPEHDGDESVVRKSVEPSVPSQTTGRDSRARLPLLVGLFVLAMGAVSVFAWTELRPTGNAEVATDDSPAEVARAFLRVTTIPPGARVAIDGRVHPEPTPTVVETEPGTARVALSLEDHATHSLEVALAEGRTAQVTHTFAQNPGRLSVESTPSGVEVSVDGEVRGRTPLELDALPREVLEVRLAAPDGYAPHMESVDLATRASAALDVTLVRRAWGLLRVNAWAGHGSLELDGREVAEDLPWQQRVPIGRHRVVFTDAQRRSRSEVVHVREGQTVTVGLQEPEP